MDSLVVETSNIDSQETTDARTGNFFIAQFQSKQHEARQIALTLWKVGKVFVIL